MTVFRLHEAQQKVPRTYAAVMSDDAGAANLMLSEKISQPMRELAALDESTAI